MKGEVRTRNKENRELLKIENREVRKRERYIEGARER
jgi:hypothetical protein